MRKLIHGSGAGILGLTTILLAFSVPDRPASAQSAGAGTCVATETMRGGRNNYIPNAPLVGDLGRGFVVAGTVREAGSCRALPNVRVQIWAATERGGEREPTNRGSVMTDANGEYRLETSPIVPNFGQPHVHIAYNDPGFGTLFLRPVLGSRADTNIRADFVLAPGAAAAPSGT